VGLAKMSAVIALTLSILKIYAGLKSLRKFEQNITKHHSTSLIIFNTI